MCASSNIESQNTTIGDKDIGDVQDGNSCSGTHRPDIEHITTYLERMELYFISNDIADAKKATFVLTCISRKTYRIVKSLLDLNLPISKSFPDIKETLKSHFSPKPSIITEQSHFNRRRQQSGESIVDFTAELGRLVINCEFEDKLEDALRYQFVSGLQSEAKHKRLLTETECLTFARAVEITSGMETAAKNVRSLHESDDNPSIKHVADHLPCKHCGRKNNEAYQCRFKSAKCHNCGKQGHISTVCRALKNTNAPNHGYQKLGGNSCRRGYQGQGKSPRLNILSRLMVKQVMIALWKKNVMIVLWKKKQWVCMG